MRFLVAADDGSLRRVEATEECNAMDKAAPLPTTTVLYQSDARTTIQCMTLLSFPSPTRGDVDAVAVAHRDGSVSIIDAETGDVLGSIAASLTAASDHRNTAAEEPSFVSIDCVHGYIGTCTSSGLARFTKLSSMWGKGEVETCEFELPAPVSMMRIHPSIPGVIAFGGKENELQIWASEQSQKNNEDDDDDDDEEDEEEDELWNSLKPLWKSKNVKNDHLDLRVPVWISDLYFLPTSEERETTSNLRLIVSTRFRQVRIYEISKARRPVRSVELSDHPIARMTLPPSPSSVASETIFCDTNANILHINAVQGTILGGFKGFAGAVTSIATSSSTPDLLLAGGMDCYIRGYSISRHQQTCCIFVGSKIHQCVVLPEDPEIKEEEEEEEVDEDEDVWDGLETVKEEREGEAGPTPKRVKRS